MATRKRMTLDSWIRDALADEKDDKKCSMIALVHMIGATPRELHHVKFGSKAPSTAEDLADMFRSKAEGYAQDLSGTQTFQLLAFYGSKEPQAFMPFIVQPATDAFNPLPSEEASDRGRLQQTMRRDEMVFQQMLRQQQVLNESAGTQITMLLRQNAELMAQNHASFAMVKDILMQKALDEHNYRMEQLAFERSSGERKKWLSMAPLLINSVTGKEIFPQSSADTVLIEQIAEKIDPEIMPLIGQVVPPELMAPLMARLEEVTKRKNKAAENATHALTAPKGNPEDDTVGGKNE